MLSGVREESPFATYERQMACTQSTARRFKEEFNTLVGRAQEDFPNLNEESGQCILEMNPDELPSGISDAEAATVRKLTFMSGQVTAVEVVLKHMLAEESTFKVNDFMNTPTEEEEAERNKFYVSATDLLMSIDISLRSILQVDSASFMSIYPVFKSALEEHWRKCVALETCGALFGGAIGAGFHGVVYPHGIFHLGLQKWLVGNFGARGAVAVGGLGGAAIATICIASVIGAWLLFEHLKKKDSRRTAKQDRLEAIHRMEQLLKENDLTPILDELTDLFDKAFVQPMRFVLNDDQCPICLEQFPADGGSGGNRPTKSSGCTGNHMVHDHCQRKWAKQCLRAGQLPSCVMCRQ